MADNVQQIKDRLSIVDVVSQYVKLERAGGSMRARCPFHAERTPSFFVSADRGTYHCFGCGVGGDIFSFVEQIEGLDFKGALKVLAEKAGVEIVYERGLPGQGGKEKKDERARLFELMEAAAIFYSSRLSDAAKKYLKERGLNNTTIKEFRLGLAGDAWSEASEYLKGKRFTEKEMLDAGLAKNRSTSLTAGNERGSLVDKFRNRVMFPIADSAGRIIGFSGRIFGDTASPDAPKYLNSPETELFHKSRILYGFDRAKLSIRKHNCAVLVEGQMDLLASHQAGWGNTVAVSGTAFTAEHATLVRRMTDNLVIALDADEAGIKAAGRAARAALQGGLNVKVAQLPSGLDPADLILKEGKEPWSKAIRESKDIITFLLDVLEEHSKGADRFRRSVEAIVLPFLSDVQSPIAREQYVQQIARRLGVSESSVSEALGKLPAPGSQGGAHGTDTEMRDGAERSVPIVNDRVHQALAILLWQKTLKHPEIELSAFEKQLEEAVGEKTFTQFQSISENERERLRFSAERLFGTTTNLKREAEALLRVILQERLSAELAEATAALKKAEKAGDQKQADVYIGVCNVLTTQIAQLHENV